MWFFSLFSPRTFGTTAGLFWCRPPATRRRSTRLSVESLEDRAVPAMFVVNTTLDTFGHDNGLLSLRQAILDANANAGPDVIAFNIGSGGVQTIAPLSPLPDITDAVTIDGQTQPGFLGTPIIELSGNQAGYGAAGLSVKADNCTIRGLVINDFAGDALDLGVLITNYAINEVVAGNYIGTDVTGTLPRPNLGYGIHVSGEALIGGTDPGAGNVVSANDEGIVVDGSHHLVVQGNRIGTNAAGTAALGNAGAGIAFQASTNDGILIGGTMAAARNLISGNFGDGLYLYSSRNNQFQGNYIGTDITGTLAIPNHQNGIEILNVGHNNTIGGDVSGAGNLISGNMESGILLQQGASDNVIAGNRIGTDQTGTHAVPNLTGIFFYGYGGEGDLLDNRVGTDGDGVGDALERNVISGNGDFGIAANAYEANRVFGTTIAGNFIGTDVTGTAALGNGVGGVWLGGWVQNSRVGGAGAGLGNVIAFNGASGGVLVVGANAVGNTISANAIFSNAGIGIDLDDDGVTPNDPGDGDVGPNNFQNFPVFTSVSYGAATHLAGTSNSMPNTTFVVEFFANSAHGPNGQRFLGRQNVTTDGNGDATFDLTLAARTVFGEWITATATDPAGNTSEFTWQPNDNNHLVTPTVVNVAIDIKPGGTTNPINLANQGVIPVAILGSATFDVSQVNVASVVFACAHTAQYSFQDVNGDGIQDLVLQFRTQDTNLQAVYEALLTAADTNTNGVLDPAVSTQQGDMISLTGQTMLGEQFQGTDLATLFLSGKSLKDFLAVLASRGEI